MTLGRRDELTQKANLRATRYGWLRLTPAYSVHLVRELLEAQHRPGGVVLDPFCGTGTTALVCAERGIAADTLDINPFLIWLAEVKTRSYSPDERASFAERAERVTAAIDRPARESAPWAPAMHQIEKWWPPEVLAALGRAMEAIGPSPEAASEGRAAADLLRIAFCRTMIELSNASFSHQSMSFKRPKQEGTLPLPLMAGPAASTERPAVEASTEPSRVVERWRAAVRDIGLGASTPILREPRALLCDARDGRSLLERGRYDLVVTSPPYPNRMSYIRELRPYMYWLGYLADGRAAGELDWRAIGGTWGSATSLVAKWEPPSARPIPYPGMTELLARIGTESELLARYVHKYFYDMVDHVESVRELVRAGGTLHYIVGNSKFYDVLLPVEQIFAAMFTAAGLTDVAVRTIRKRTSKKELFEFVVSARKPE